MTRPPRKSSTDTTTVRILGRDFVVSHAVPYEVWMMRETADLLLGGMLLAGPLRNAAIESFAVHARGLIDFFRGKDGSDARHFTSSAYQPFRAGISRGVVRKINTQIAHITENRTLDPIKKLNGNHIRELRRTLDAEIAEFLEHMLPAYRAIWDARKIT